MSTPESRQHNSGGDQAEAYRRARIAYTAAEVILSTVPTTIFAYTAYNAADRNQVLAAVVFSAFGAASLGLAAGFDYFRRYTRRKERAANSGRPANR